MNLVILAGGRSSRMTPITRGAPKALLRLGAATLLDRHLNTALELPASQTIIIVNSSDTAIERHLAQISRPPPRLTVMRGGHGYVPDLVLAFGGLAAAQPTLCLDADIFIPTRDVLALGRDDPPLVAFGSVPLATLRALDIPIGDGAVFAQRGADAARFGRDLAAPTHLVAGCHKWSWRAATLLREFVATQEPRWGKFLDVLARQELVPTMVELSLALNLNTPDEYETARRHAATIDH